MWLWHVPALYDAALETPIIHTVEHLSFAAAGLLYWWHLLSPIRSRLRLAGMGPILYMGSTKILVGLLGVLLAFSPEVLYAYSWEGTKWGLTPLDDQNVAGLVMALEQSIVMGIALAYLFFRMLAESEAEDQRAERYGARDWRLQPRQLAQVARRAHGQAGEHERREGEARDVEEAETEAGDRRPGRASSLLTDGRQEITAAARRLRPPVDGP